MSDRQPPAHPNAFAFDIIGTVFEVEPLRLRLIALGLPGAALEGWTAAADRDAAAMAAAGDYASFAEVARAALDSVLAEQKLAPPPSERQALVDAMADMTPRGGAGDAFRAAADAGVRVLALTNGSAGSTRALLGRAGLLDFFAHIVSTDEVRLAKPRPEVYHHACRVAEVSPDRLALVAAHDWDIQGGVAAGLTTAYVSAERPYSTAMRPPYAQAETLPGCVAALLAL